MQAQHSASGGGSAHYDMFSLADATALVLRPVRPEGSLISEEGPGPHCFKSSIHPGTHANIDVCLCSVKVSLTHCKSAAVKVNSRKSAPHAVLLS